MQSIDLGLISENPFNAGATCMRPKEDEAVTLKVPLGDASPEPTAARAASKLAVLTALQVLQSRVKAGDRVLIHAGSGGVGHFAIHIFVNIFSFLFLWWMAERNAELAHDLR